MWGIVVVYCVNLVCIKLLWVGDCCCLGSVVVWCDWLLGEECVGCCWFVDCDVVVWWVVLGCIVCGWCEVWCVGVCEVVVWYVWWIGVVFVRN